MNKLSAKSGKGKTRRDNIRGYLFLSPWLLGFLMFTFFPLFYTFYLSFNDVKLTALGWEMTPIGFENHITALLRNLEFTPAMLGFILMALVYVPGIVIIAFILAILLNQKLRFRSFFRTIFFLPVIVLSGSVMHQLMDTGSTDIMFVDQIFIFSMVYNFSPFVARVIYILFENFTMLLWFTGIPIVLFINGLQKIDRSLYEASQIDGASPWQSFWKITVPVIKPIALISTLYTIVQLGMFPINPVYTMIKEAIYNTAGGLGLASAYAYIYSFVIAVIIGLAYLILRDKEVIAPVTKYRTRG
ncbi:MAG: sugar ABC transporter permease [Clostridiaceae bacterium]|mgnify:CR=1 FL=1|jgi:oligogalacturonide transport system permease protein|nr:sugar ABC transporter permease [Clostridiaceae bacterium]